jgi:fructose-bisphosphate aldolase class I
MNAMGKHPWELSFSYGRALQDPVLKAWKGKAANVPSAKEAFFLRAKLNGAARHGNYSPAMEASS